MPTETHVRTHAHVQIADWLDCTEEAYQEAFEVLPPIAWHSRGVFGSGFLLGEPFDHAICQLTNEGRARYTAYVEQNGRFYYSDRPLTVPEFLRGTFPNQRF